MKIHALTFLAASVFLAARADAGIVTGTVVNALGQPVAQVNLDAAPSSGGGNPTVSNDSTNALGQFATTITPDGVYDITFNPPPTMAPYPVVLKDVVVVGTVNLGTIVLPDAVTLTGTVRNYLNQPVAGVNLDVLDPSGNLEPTSNDTTDVFGNFNIAVLKGVNTLQIDPAGLLPLSAPREIQLNLAGNTALGNVTLQQGFTLSATVRRSNGTAVANVDIDVASSSTKQKLYTPGDNSNATGLVDVVVPAGTYDVEFCPVFNDHLQCVVQTNKVVTTTTNLGVVTLPAGVVLSGTVQAFNGTKYAGVDVDLFLASTGAEVPLCLDNTASNGSYQVIVPTGTFHVKFTPPGCLPLGSQQVNNVVISTNKTQNGTLPSVSSGTVVGTGTPGTGGLVPTIAGVCTPRLGNASYGVAVANARGGATAFLSFTPNVLGATHVSGPFGLANEKPLLRIKLGGAAGVAGAGSGTFELPIKNEPALLGLTLKARCFVVDPNGAADRAWTPYLHATLVL
ncbi:MAG: hypothetical protein L6Q99_00030 [Planctomycetes bacterium]|nr:hypothetical protein [Planctomycetota bacterium]